MASVLAFAAKHMNALSLPRSAISIDSIGPTVPAGGPFSSHFEQRATTLLAQEVQSLTKVESSAHTTPANTIISLNRSNAILASMLVLCNVETIWPG